MKKLTDARRIACNLVVERARPALVESEGFSSMTQEWRDLMRIVWHAEEVLQKELGLSMTRSWAVIRDGVDFMSFYDADGNPLKVVR